MKSTLKQLYARERIERYHALFSEILGKYENDHPQWETETLLSLITDSLEALRAHFESKNHIKENWNIEFLEFKYPVECNWPSGSKGDIHEYSLDTGLLTDKNTANRRIAIKTLGEILTRHLRIVTLQGLTNHVAIEKKGKLLHNPIISPEIAKCLARAGSPAKCRQILEALYHPFSMGVTTINAAVFDLETKHSLSKDETKELSRRTKLMDHPGLEFDGLIKGHQAKVRIAFQISPLVINANKREAYFPITIGIVISPLKKLNANDMFKLMAEGWLNTANWTVNERRMFWRKLLIALKAVSRLPIADKIAQKVNDYVTITTTLKVPVTSAGSEGIDEATRCALDTFSATGAVQEFRVHETCGMEDANAWSELRQLLNHITVAKSPTEKGQILERLIAQLFKTIKGFEILKKNLKTKTEEIDLVVLNRSKNPRLEREGAWIIVECKNWVSSCGKNEYVQFREKIQNRRGRCTMGFLISWNGFTDTVEIEAMRGSRESPIIVTLTGHQISDAIAKKDFATAIDAAWDKTVGA